MVCVVTSTAAENLTYVSSGRVAASCGTVSVRSNLVTTRVTQVGGRLVNANDAGSALLTAPLVLGGCRAYGESLWAESMTLR